MKKFLLILMVLIFTALGVRAFWIEPNMLIVKRQTIKISRWPDKYKNFKIAVIADIHAGAPFINTDKIKKIVQLTNQEKPDVIFLLGDYVAYRVLGGHLIEPEITANIIKNLKSKYGIYAVLGNHDREYNGNRVWKAFEKVHIIVLENNAVKIKLKQGYLWIAGLADLQTGYPDIYGTINKITDKSPVIMLSHHPDLFRVMPSRINLTISGHTHCGQVNFPIVGSLIVPSLFGQLYSKGHVHEKNRDLFVSCGIGTSDLAVRFRVKPEINILKLVQK